MNRLGRIAQAQKAIREQHDFIATQTMTYARENGAAIEAADRAYLVKLERELREITLGLRRGNRS